jgi:hypothetical protein
MADFVSSLFKGKHVLPLKAIIPLWAVACAMCNAVCTCHTCHSVHCSPEPGCPGILYASSQRRCQTTTHTRRFYTVATLTSDEKHQPSKAPCMKLPAELGCFDNRTDHAPSFNVRTSGPWPAAQSQGTGHSNKATLMSS